MLPKQPSSRRFPLHTLLLMLVALVLSIRLWWISRERRAENAGARTVEVLSDRAPIRDAGPGRDAGAP